ncbi:glutathione S-transferase family protein [Paracoccus caeni]|uniref:Glutathione S-transferase family protein n=1 Tax=Paracoccus caeni TaxID=657651 RepID=A0A934W081_9RHOB|nr:glutathione S-transferase family protein [Paracoccus caeni]MBK4216048.1 glutathione S-transferase family protein [Paracoccus caeni]
MIPTITAFANSLDQGAGLARDMRVRWALEEVGQPYNTRLVSWEAMKQPTHLASQPFGQIPSYEMGDLILFESGAIVLHVALHNPGLLPEEADARARAITWLFAALNTVEPPIFDMDMAQIIETEKPWYDERLALLKSRIRDRLRVLTAQLAGNDWLEGGFSAGDLMMIAVLRMLHGTELLAEFPAIAAYVARGEARPAFRRAFDAQLADFKASSQAD